MSVRLNLGVGEFNLISTALLKSDKSRALVVNKGYLLKIGNKTFIILVKSLTTKTADLPSILTTPICKVLQIFRNTSISSTCRRIMNLNTT